MFPFFHWTLWHEISKYGGIMFPLKFRSIICSMRVFFNLFSELGILWTLKQKAKAVTRPLKAKQSIKRDFSYHLIKLLLGNINLEMFSLRYLQFWNWRMRTLLSIILLPRNNLRQRLCFERSPVLSILKKKLQLSSLILNPSFFNFLNKLCWAYFDLSIENKILINCSYFSKQNIFILYYGCFILTFSRDI